jgi:hypothetical protein
MKALGATKVYDRPSALGYGERCTAVDTKSTCLAVYLHPSRIDVNQRHWCFKECPANKWTHFSRQASPPGDVQTVNQGFGLTTIATTMQRSCSIRLAIVWKRYVIPPRIDTTTS